MAQPKTPPLSIRLPAETLSALKDEARRRSMSVNALVLRAVRKEIGQWSDEEVETMKAKARPAFVANRIEAPALNARSLEMRAALDAVPLRVKGVQYGYPVPKPRLKGAKK